MEERGQGRQIQYATRHYFKIAAFAGLGIVVGGALTLGLLSITSSNTYEAPSITIAENAMARSEPVRLWIPAVAIEADFEAPLGVMENGEIEVPHAFDTVGWYKYGPTPGEQGPAVILGHVDSKAGPEVFYSLRDIEEGDEIFIEREDGSTAEFVVTSIEKHPQNDFPTKEVYGDLSYPGLRLITCSGVYDRGIQRYSHNLIVYAKLKE